MANIAHSKESASIQLEADENKDLYIHTKYTSNLSVNISQPLKVRVLNMNSDATKYSAEDLVSYIELVMKDKWTDGSQYTAGAQNLDLKYMMVSFTLYTIFKNDSGRWESKDFGVINSIPDNGDFARINSRYDSDMKYNHRIVAYGPNVVKYRSEPQMDYEQFKDIFKIRMGFTVIDQKDKFSQGQTFDIMYDTSASGYTNLGLQATTAVCPVDATHYLLGDIEDSGAINWYVVASKDPF